MRSNSVDSQPGFSQSAPGVHGSLFFFFFTAVSTQGQGTASKVQAKGGQAVAVATVQSACVSARARRQAPQSLESIEPHSKLGEAPKARTWSIRPRQCWASFRTASYGATDSGLISSPGNPPSSKQARSSIGLNQQGWIGAASVT